MADETVGGPDASTAAPPAGRRRRRSRMALLVLAVIVGLVVAVAGVAYVQLDRSIKTFPDRGISKRRPPATVAGQNILLIGSDSRAGADRGLGGKGSAVGRSDTALFVHIYEGGRRAVSVSIPRDALVDIPPCLLPDGTWSRPQHHAMFNEAFSVGQTKAGNPACTVNTVEKLTHLRVDHTVVADFAGFAAMTDIVGGVQVCLPHAVYQGDLDPNLPDRGNLVFRRGKQTVSGGRALDFVRLRHGVGDGSDIGRMRRQQAFLGSVVTKVRKEGLTPTHILPLAEAATKYLTVDARLGSAQAMLSFVLGLRHMTPDNIVFLTAPWRYAGARVALVHPDVERLWAALRADQPVPAGEDRRQAPRPTVAQNLAKVTAAVTVLNASATTGLGTRTAGALRAAGLTVGRVANAAHERRTVVEYGPGQATQAQALASAFVHATTRSRHAAGVRLLLGARHRMRSADAPAGTPGGKLPASITSGTRSAATDTCSGVSYGAGSTP